MKKLIYITLCIVAGNLLSAQDRVIGALHATRSVVMAQNGMVATSHPLATQIGLDILKSGGNAIEDETFEDMSMPTTNGSNRLAGIDFTKRRTKIVTLALLGLSMKPGGFTSKDLSEELKPLFDNRFSNRKASYDIKKLRGKGLVLKVSGSIKYVMTEKGKKTLQQYYAC